MPAKEGSDRGSEAGEHAVGAVGAEGAAGVARGRRVLNGPPLPHRRRHCTAAAAIAALAAMLCSPGFEHSRRSQLFREGSACGWARRRGASRRGGGRPAVALPQSRAANG